MIVSQQSTNKDADRLRPMLDGYRATCLLIAAVRAGLIDRLARGPAGEAQLASELPAHPQALSRLVRALVMLGVLERQGDQVALSSGGRWLLETRDWAVLIDAEYLRAWGELGHTVRTGQTAFDHAFGMSVWEHRQRHPELNASFNRTMVAYQHHMIDAIASTYDFSRARRIVDVGGGAGTDLAQILAANPSARGVVFDQPHVVESAAEVLRSAGVDARCERVGGSFFAAVPPGADLYLLKHVLHNWGDAQALDILRTIRKSMSADATLVVVENVLPQGDQATGGILLDMHMMAVLGGRERTLAEYRDLLGGSGLTLVRCLDAKGATEILEAKPADERG